MQGAGCRVQGAGCRVAGEWLGTCVHDMIRLLLLPQVCLMCMCVSECVREGEGGGIESPRKTHLMQPQLSP